MERVDHPKINILLAKQNLAGTYAAVDRNEESMDILQEVFFGIQGNLKKIDLRILLICFLILLTIKKIM